MNLFTTRARVTAEQLAELPPPANFAEQIMRDRGITFGAVRK